MDEKLLNNIILNQELFVPSIFTSNHINIIKKYLNSKILTNSEKKSLYTSIKNKLKALNSISEEKENLFIRGNLIPSRLNEAKKIIKFFKSEKVFVAGSFLFSKRYNDIDIFVLRKRGYKEIFKDNRHIVYITEKHLSQPLFQSAAMISVSNFNTVRDIKLKKPFLHELMSLYHESIIQIKNKKREAFRDLLFYYYLFVKKRLIDSLELRKAVLDSNVNTINSIFRSLCTILFSKKYLYVELIDYKNTLDKAIKTEKNISHLKHYKRNYEAMIYATNKAKGY